MGGGRKVLGLSKFMGKEGGSEKIRYVKVVL